MTRKWRKRRKRNPWFDIFDDIEKTENERENNHPYIFRGNSRRKNMRYPYIRTMKARKTYRRTPFFKEPEPLLDILENGEIITVVIDLPGFKGEDINIYVKGARLIVSASTLDKRYYKNLKLPAKVEAKPIYKSYKNGVFELRFKKFLENKILLKSEG